MRILSNISSLAAQRSFERISKAISSSLARLSTGNRVNSARDDAAGLSRIVQFQSQVTGLARTLRNINEGVGMLNTAEAALQSQIDLVQRMKELAVQSANGTLSGNDRANLQAELDQLMSEFNDIAHRTEWNGRRLLSIDSFDVPIQVGTSSGSTLNIDFSSSSPSETFTKETYASLNSFSNLNQSVSLGGGSIFIDLNQDQAEDLITFNESGVATIHLNNGSGTFTTKGTFQTSYAASTGEIMVVSNASITAADVNRDGRKDLIISDSSKITAMLNNGQGGFSSSMVSAQSANGNQLLDARDYNGDGHLDILSTQTLALEGSILLALGRGDGSFSNYQTVSGLGSGSVLQAIDINKDGYLDLVSETYSGPRTRLIRMGSASGTFTVGRTFSDLGTTSTTGSNMADFNGDGYLDFIDYLSTGNNQLTLGTASGVSASSTTFDTGLLTTSNIMVGDIDGDGDQDFIGANSSGSVIVRLNNGSGSFSRSVTVSLGTNWTAQALVDFNKDGRADLFAANSVSSQIALRLSLGTGSFGSAATLSVDSGTTFLRKDINQDGFMDLYGINSTSGTLRFMLGSSAGLTSFSSLSTSATGDYFSSNEADLNGDGLTDLLVLGSSLMLGNSSSAAFIQNSQLIYSPTSVSLGTQSGSQDALEIFDRALDNLSERISHLGAQQNRLASAAAAHQTIRESLKGALEDTQSVDLASELSELTRLQILQRATAAVLTQANLSLSLALSLFNDS